MWWLSWMTENWYFTYKVDTKLRLTNAAWGQGHLMESSGKTAPVTHWLSGCSQPWDHYRTERQGSETGSFHSGGVGYRHLQNILTMCGEKFNNLATWNLIQNAEGVLHQNKMFFFGSMIIYVERDHDVTDEGHRPPLTKADLSTAHSWMTSPSGIEKKAEPPPVTISQGSWEVTGLSVTSWVLVPPHSTQFKSIVR